MGNYWRELGEEYGPYSNSCACRVSHALNHGGNPIPSGSPGANYNFGGDNAGLRYILSARQLQLHLSEAWGTAAYTNITHDQLETLSTSLLDGQVAVVVSKHHATVLTQGYTGDKYTILGVGGSAWILPVKPITVE